MNNKGFTLIELIAVIVVFAVLGLLLIPKTLKIINDSKLNSYKEVERRLEEAAGKYILDEYIDTTQDSITITKAQLKEKKLIDEIYDFNDNSVCDAYVEVSNLRKSAEFKAYLSCANYITESFSEVPEEEPIN